MLQKQKKNESDSIKKSLYSIRKCLDNSITKGKDKNAYRLKFSRIGRDYKIEDAPVPQTDRMGVELEVSFNTFMKNLKVEYDGVKVEGLCFIDKEKNSFLIGYQNYKRRGDKAYSNIHKIKGSMG